MLEHIALLWASSVADGTSAQAGEDGHIFDEQFHPSKPLQQSQNPYLLHSPFPEHWLWH